MKHCGMHVCGTDEGKGHTLTRPCAFSASGPCLPHSSLAEHLPPRRAHAH